MLPSHLTINFPNQKQTLPIEIIEFPRDRFERNLRGEKIGYRGLTLSVSKDPSPKCKRKRRLICDVIGKNGHRANILIFA